MFVEFTVYLARIDGQEPTVGWNMWSQQGQPRYQIGGDPCTKIGEFERIVSGTNQHGLFFDECSRLGIDLQNWLHA